MNKSGGSNTRILLGGGAGKQVWQQQVAHFARSHKGRTLYSRPTADGRDTELFVRDKKRRYDRQELRVARHDAVNLLRTVGLVSERSRKRASQRGAAKRSKAALAPDGQVLGRRNGSYVLGKAIGDPEKRIRHAIRQEDAKNVVIKTLDSNRVGWEECRTNLLLSRLDTPHLLKCLDVGVAGGGLALVMEPAEHGTLAELMDKAERLRNMPRSELNPDLKKVKASLDSIFLLVVDDALAGFEAMHAQGFLHRDVRPENIFIGDGFVAKVGDFGTCMQAGKVTERTDARPENRAPEDLTGGIWLARALEAREKVKKRLQRRMAKKEIDFATAKQQLEAYDSRKLGAYPLTTAADIYALAPLVHRLFHGEELVQAEEVHVRNAVIEESRLHAKTPKDSPVNARLAPKIQGLVNTCKQRTAFQRPTAALLRQHEAFAQMRGEKRKTELRGMLQTLIEAKI